MLRPSSYAIYQGYAKKYILPYIGNLQAEDFNARIPSEMLGRLLYTGSIEGKGVLA